MSGKLCVMGWSVVEYTFLGVEGIACNQETWVSLESVTGLEEIFESVQGKPYGVLVVFELSKASISFSVTNGDKPFIRKD